MNTNGLLLELIQHLYTAPGTSEGWQAFLNGLRIALGGAVCSLVSQNMKSGPGSVAVASHADSLAVRLDEQRSGSSDPWVRSPHIGLISPQPVVGDVVGDELSLHPEIRRTACHQDLSRHRDLVRTLAATVETGPDALSIVSITASECRGPFRERDVALLEPLVPHIRRALQLHRRLAAANRAVDDVASVVDAASRGVVLIASSGRVAFMNREASRLTSMRDGVTVDHGEIRAAAPSDNARLRSIVAEAVRTSSGCGVGSGGALSVGRPSGRRPVQVLVCPVPRQRASFPGVQAAAAIMSITDPELVVVPDGSVLRSLFGLTPAEARLTCLIARGSSLQDAGAELGLRRETARSRLKTIFKKTSVHRRAELVRLVMDTMPRI